MATDIRQTNRTILLEEINPEMLDLMTLVGDVRGMDSLADEKIQEIDQTLLVGSFQEFLDKFQPKVYSYYDSVKQSVEFTLKKPENLPEHLITVIPLNMSNDFFKMLCSLIDTKRATGQKNVDFQFESVLSQITPKKVMEDVRQSRKELAYTLGQYSELEEGDPKKLDLGDKLNVLMEEASRNYNNVLALLPLAIEDSETRLLLGAGDHTGKSEKIAAGILQLGTDGALKVLEAPKPDETALALVESGSNQALVAALEEDYEALNEENGNDYVKALVVRAFCPLAAASQQEIDYETEVANHNAYLDFYTQAKQNFIKVARPLIEKMLGIKEFFAQYTVKGRGMRPTLLIANTRPDLLAKSNLIPRVQTYLNTINNKNDYDHSLWFAIFPNLSFSKSEGIKITRQRFAGNQKVEHANVNTMETLATLCEIFHNYGVKIFFSFDTIEETTFNKISSDGVAPFIDRCEPLMDKPYSAYAVPCMPNMTIVPKDKSGVVTGAYMKLGEDGNSAQLSKEKEDICRLWVEGVYISAAYVAAGMMAACQCPEYLKERFVKNVHPDYPGVRYDIEDGNNALVTTTTLAKEITGFTQSVKAEINNKNFGFIFGSENVKFNGIPVERLTVYKARSLASDGTAFEPIFQTQVETYFDRVFRQATSDYKQDNIISFFSSNPSSQMSQWLNNKHWLNAIIQQGDEITYTMDEENGTCDIGFTFNGSSRNMRIQLQRRTASVKAAK